MTQTRIQKWENSQAIHLSKILLEVLQLHENDEVIDILFGFIE